MGASRTLLRKLDLDLIARIEASGPPEKPKKPLTKRKPRLAETYRQNGGGSPAPFKDTPLFNRVIKANFYLLVVSRRKVQKWAFLLLVLKKSTCVRRMARLCSKNRRRRCQASLGPKLKDSNAFIAHHNTHHAAAITLAENMAVWL